MLEITPAVSNLSGWEAADVDVDAPLFATRLEAGDDALHCARKREGALEGFVLLLSGDDVVTAADPGASKAMTSRFDDGSDGEGEVRDESAGGPTRTTRAAGRPPCAMNRSCSSRRVRSAPLAAFSG